MEKEEDKIQEINGTTKSSSTCFRGNNECDDKDRNGVFSNDLIPIDITREILMRLPAKSIVRFRCVSKLWWSITTQPDFISSFAVRQSLIPSQSLLLTFTKKDWDKQIFCMLPFDENSTSYSDVNNFRITPPKKDCRYFYHYTSINGLITFRNETEIIIWNPSMKEHITLPKPKISEHVDCFLGYNPTENTYKLLSMASFQKTGEKYQKPQILTLGSQESWRVAENSPAHDPKSCGYCINGFVYYRAHVTYEEGDLGIFGAHQEICPHFCETLLSMRIKEIIMSFDVRSEQFKPIQIPGRVHDDGSRINNSLMSYKGRLAWVCSNSNFIKIWVLQDAEKQEWSEKEFVLPLPQRELLMSARLNGSTSTGEFIYLPRQKLFKDISVFYYDPVRESIRCVKGLDYEKFRRCYGSSNESMFNIQSYPDHIESLMSLKNIICSPFV